MRKIPFGRPMIGEEERAAVTDVLKGDILVHGPRAKEFESAFCSFTGAANAVAVSSCTAALHLVYFSLGIGNGAEVIVPAQTHVATAHAVELTGAKPVFVDAERATGNIDIEQIAAAITPRTRAISLVHFLGMPADVRRINEIAAARGLLVIEDCALAIGSYLDGDHAGTIGDFGCFSFYPVKHLTTAEGGMLLVKNAELAAKIARQRAFGVDRTASERQVPGEYDVNMLGFNYRMSEPEAALGIAQLKRIRSFLEARKRNYETLARRLQEIEELSLLQSTQGRFQSSYYCLTAILNERWAAKRFDIIHQLNAQGIGTSVYYPRPVPHLSYYREKYGFRTDSYPNASRISYQSIALPVGPHLTPEDMEYIADRLKDAIAALSRR